MTEVIFHLKVDSVEGQGMSVGSVDCVFEGSSGRKLKSCDITDRLMADIGWREGNPTA